MAECDKGYLCEVCGEAVEDMAESALYLQFIVGWIDPETLHTRRECHLRCQPTLSQFINDPLFQDIQVTGEFSRQELDPAFVKERSDLLTRGYQRLVEVARKRRGMTVTDYPLPEAIARWQ